MCKYNVTDINTSTALFNSSNNFSSMIVDDEEKEVTKSYIFNTTGEHTVLFTLADGVTLIDTGAFENCSALASVIIGNSVASIGPGAFSGCSALTNITIPDSATYIGAGAFADCSGLINVTIGNSISDISYGAFNNCSALTNIICNVITAPSIYPNTFQGIKSGGTLIVPAGSTGYDIWVGKDDYYSENLGKYNWTILEQNQVLCKYNVTDTSRPTTLFGSANNFSSMSIDGEEKDVTNSYTFNTTDEHTVLFTLADGVTSIGEYAFNNCSALTSVTLGNSVTSIGNHAFAYCSGLTSITIPDSVTSIGDYAFYKCTSLTSITIGNSVTSIGEYTFSDSGLTSIIIPDSITSISSAAFYECSELTSVIIGNSVTSISSAAFQNCSELTSITIPDSVTSIGDTAFYNCSGLMNITCNATTAPTIQDWTFQSIKSDGTLTVPVGSTGYDAWMSTDNYYLGKYNWTILEENQVLCKYNVADTESATTLLDSTNNFSSMKVDGEEKEVGKYYTFNSTGEHTVLFTLADGTTSIGNNAFSYCTGLTNVIIPDSVTSIGNEAFYGCKDLTSIVIPDSVTNIDNKAFNNCSGLASVTIGSGVTNIGESAFQGCSGLTSINIPNSVTSIGNYALEWCDGLTNVIIGSGVTSIGSSVFLGCSSLASITVDSNNTVYDSRNNCNAIIETVTNTLISGCKNTVIPSDVTSIGSSAFGSCDSLTSIDIPNSVTNIGGWAFSNCSSLTSVTIGSSVTSIGESAFQYCSGLTSIVSNAMAVPTIQSNTFQKVKADGVLTVPRGSTGYDAWMSTNAHYLGYYNWTKIEQ